MQQIIIFVLILLIVYLLYSLNNNGLVRANFNGDSFVVQDHSDKSTAIELLKKLRDNLLIIAQKSLERAKSDKNTDYQKYISKIVNKLSGVLIREVEKDSPYTSYSVNKGEELVFCLRNKKTHEFYDYNKILYVAVHEIAHIGCPEIGHTKLFFELNRYLLQTAKDNNMYTFVDYNNKPEEYCGIKIYTNVLNYDL